METFAYISCVILGIALGVGGDWLFWQVRFKDADKRVREESKAVGQAFNAQIEEKEQQLAALNADFVAAREELAGMKVRLEEESRHLEDSQALNARLPILEKSIADQQVVIEQLRMEKGEIESVVAALEAKIAADRKAFDDGLVYVHGSHYLPASVVRNLTAGRTHAADSAGGEEDL